MIEVNNLKFRYKNNLPFILDSLSFCVNDGEIMSILGKNGVGKTTLLRCLISDLSDYSGTILIEGQDARTIKAVELSKKIAVVASNSICYQNLSVGDYLVTGMANRLASLHTPSKELYEEAYEILLELGQAQLINNHVHDVSTGEMQIIKIARAILQNPKTILFDEPTSNLDVKNQLLVLNQITALSERGYSVITTTHNPGQVLELGGTVLMLSEECNYSFGPVDDVVTERNLTETYGLEAHIQENQFRQYVAFEDSISNHRLFY